MPARPDIGLLRLAHVALRSPDPERLAVYYERNVGLVRVAADDDVIRLTTDHHSHCLELHYDDAVSLHHVAFEVRDLDAAGAALGGGPDGVTLSEIESPGYAAAAAFTDPEGNAVRLVQGTATSTALPAGSRVFRPRKLGHVGVRGADLHGLVDFYTANLGFRLSDWIGEQVVFLRCNPDHHALVFVAEPSHVSSMHHMAYEVPSWEGFADQADILAGNGVSVGWGPGRHNPSQNYFMYFDDDDGNRIEWMAGVRLIYDDEGHEPQVFDPSVPTTWNVWGVLPPPEFLRGLGPTEQAAAR
jgi:catechol-2,3-dioxygenase